MKRSIFWTAILAGLALGSAVRDVQKRACAADDCLRALTGTGSLQGTTRPVLAKSDCSSFMRTILTTTVTPATVTSTVTRLSTQTSTLVQSATTTVTSTTTTATTTTTTTTPIPSTITTAVTASTQTLTVTVTTATSTVTTTVSTTLTAATTTISTTLYNKRSAHPLDRVVRRSANPVPSYASACSGTVRFSSACSCFGITGTTSLTTATANTPTAYVTVTTTKTSTKTSSTAKTNTATAVITTTSTTVFTAATVTVTVTSSITALTTNPITASTTITSTVTNTATTTAMSITTIENYFTNGGLDNGNNLSPWQATEASISIEHDNVYSGTGALIATTDQFGDCAFNQPVSLPMGKSYTVSFYVYSVNGAACSGSSLFYNYYQLNDSPITFGPSQSYTFFSFSFFNNIAASGPFQIGITCNNAQNTFQFEFDNFALVQNA
jgi:hypothetical protein